jgi:hypothetical protein
MGCRRVWRSGGAMISRAQLIGGLLVAMVLFACNSGSAPEVDGPTVTDGRPDAGGGSGPCASDCQCPTGFCVNGACSPHGSGRRQGICQEQNGPGGNPSHTCLCQGGGAICRGECCYLPDGGIADPQGPICLVPCQTDCQCAGAGYKCSYDDSGTHTVCRPDLEAIPQGDCGTALDGGPVGTCSCNGATCRSNCCYLPDGGVALPGTPACE